MWGFSLGFCWELCSILLWSLTLIPTDHYPCQVTRFSTFSSLLSKICLIIQLIEIAGAVLNPCLPLPIEVSCSLADHIQGILAGFAEQSKTSVLHMSSLYHAFLLCQVGSKILFSSSSLFAGLILIFKYSITAVDHLFGIYGWAAG